MTTMTKLLPEDTLMFSEAGSASAVVQKQLTENALVAKELGKKLRNLKPSAVVTCARGSSDHAATYAKYVIETKAGLLVSSAAPSVSSVYAATQMLEGTLFIAISQSGASPDLVRTADAARQAGAFVVAIVNVTSSPLAAIADVVLPMHAGPEKSVAATKTYIASLTAILQLVAHWTEDGELLTALETLPLNLSAAWACDWAPAAAKLLDARNFFVVGRGVGFGVAQEAALKFKETCGLHAEAYSAAEVKHGPMAIVNAERRLGVRLGTRCRQAAGRPELFRGWPGRGLWRGAGSRAQIQGNLRPARGSLFGRRSEARPDGHRECGLPRAGDEPKRRNARRHSGPGEGFRRARRRCDDSRRGP